MSILIFSLIGILIGVTSSLFGFGGGFIIVPILYAFLPNTIPVQYIMHTAIGTSLAVMIINSLNSTYNHSRKRNIQWEIFKYFFLYIALGAIVGGGTALFLDSGVLRIMFILFLIYVIISNATEHSFIQQADNSFIPPTHTERAIAGIGIGSFSTLLGIGGGVMTIPYLRKRGLRMLHAVALATPLGLPIAIVGTLMYLIIGLQVPNMPVSTVGFIYLPALFGFIFGGFFGVPIGRRIAQTLPDALFSRIYLLLLVIVVLMMVIA